MSKKLMSPEVRKTIAALIQSHPDLRPSELLAMLQKGHPKGSEVKTLTVQSIVGIRRSLSKESEASVEPSTDAIPVRLKNLRTGKIMEYPRGQAGFFRLPGDPKMYSIEDFADFIRKNVGEMKVVGINSEITQLPLGDLDVVDLFATR